MDIFKRLLGVSAIIDPARHDPVGADVNGLIRRLILFDTYILKTLRLREFPFLVSSLGFDGTLELLRSGAFEIECECISSTQIGQLNIISSRTQKGLLPHLSYSMSALDAADHHKYLHDNLQPLHDIPGLTRKQVIKLKRAIVDKVVRVPNGFASTIAARTTSEILAKPQLVRKSVQLAAHRMGFELGEFSIEVRAIDAEDIRVETDIAKRLDIDIARTHALVEHGLLGVGGLVQRLAEMEAYTALSGFIDQDLPLYSEHLDFLARSLSPHSKEKQFERIIGIAGLPDFSAAVSNGRLNIGRLLEIRESTECREFRDWLPTVAEASDSEIHERVRSLRAKVGNAIQTTEGKVMRFLATTGIGFLPLGQVAGFVAGALDAFLLEKVLPRSGPAAFLNKLYPSIFEKQG